MFTSLVLYIVCSIEHTKYIHSMYYIHTDKTKRIYVGGDLFSVNWKEDTVHQRIRLEGGIEQHLHNYPLYITLKVLNMTQMLTYTHTYNIRIDQIDRV